MFLIRNFEYTAADLYSKTKIFGALHNYAGEEAVAVGVCSNLRKDDYVFGSHRGHGIYIAKGGNVQRLMAELFARETGICKAKGGSMHVADVSVGMLGASGIVGAGIPLATGAGLSAKYRGTDQVSVCFFGDGASNQGVFHESLNLASIWDLPVIYVCENNQYAEATRYSDAMRVKHIADRAAAYGIPGIVTDGMDVSKVYGISNEAIERARRGNGPTLIECNTYRFEGHEMGDPYHTYRTKIELNEWKARCPIATLRAKLLNDGVLTEKALQEIEQGVLKELEEAIKFSEASAIPDPESAFTDVFVTGDF
jgi:TPP-dependent pyruvate/acetoin dehydrogenase alpha subunit